MREADGAMKSTLFVSIQSEGFCQPKSNPDLCKKTPSHNLTNTHAYNVSLRKVLSKY